MDLLDPAESPAPKQAAFDLVAFTETIAEASTADAIADVVVDGLADALNAERCTLLKAAPELLLPLGQADRGPLLDAELQIAGAVMRSREPRFISQTAHSIAIADGEHPADVEVSTLALPLVACDGLVGVIVATWLGRREAPSERERRLARLVAAVTAVAMDRAFLGEQTRLLHTTDPLTGAGSRESLVTLLDVLRDRGMRHALVLLDIDNFAQYNEALGVESGDRLLAALATMVARECRDGDALVRSGADEFALVLPGQTADSGAVTARRIVDAVADWGHEDHLTISAGVAARSSDTSADVLESAMSALREAKNAGRGRIALS